MRTIVPPRFVILAALSAALLSTTAVADTNRKSTRQPGSFGVKAGIAFSTLKGYDAAQIESRTGTAFGLQFLSTKGRMLAVQIEALSVQKGCTLDQDYFLSAPVGGPLGNEKRDARFSYAEFCVLLKFYPSPRASLRPNVFAGVAPALLLSADLVNADVTDYVENSDFGIVGGIGLDVQAGANSFSFELRHTYGLQPLIDLDWVDDKIRNSSWLFTVGLIF